MLTRPHRLPTSAKGSLVLLVVFTLLGAFFLLVLRPGGQQLGCQLTLRYRWQPLFAEYSRKNPEGKYPPLSAVPGVFAPDYDAVKPFIAVEDGPVFHCPTAVKTYPDLSVEEQLRHPTYAYFGYAFETESELLAFLDCYPDFIERGVDFSNDLPAPSGRGSFGGNFFLRLEKTPRNSEAKRTAESLFVLMELPLGANATQLPHRKNKGTILYAQDAMRSIAYGTEPPMTSAVLSRINAIRLKYATAPPGSQTSGQR